MFRMSRFVFTNALFIVLAGTVSAKDFKVVGQEFMPYQGSGADGKMVGGYYEMAKRVCEKMKYNCTFEVVPLTRALDMIKDGSAQMVLGVAKNPEREAIANFPSMLSQAGYTFFVKKGTASKFTKIEDFKGKNVGVHGGSATGKDLIEQNKKIGDAIKITEEAVAETGLKKLAGGRYGDDGAVYCTRPVCLFQAKKESLDVEPVSFDPKLQNHSAPVSKKVDQAEFDKIKKAIDEVMKTTEMKKIFADYNIPIHPDLK